MSMLPIISIWLQKITGFITVPFRYPQNLERTSLLGSKYVMTHLGSSGDLAEKEMFGRLEESFAKIFDDYNGSAKLLIENSAGAKKSSVRISSK